MAGTVLVTGATGYIAGELIRQLLAKGWTVHGTVRNVAKSEAGLRKRLGNPLIEQLRLFEAELMSDSGWAEATAARDASPRHRANLRKKRFTKRTFKWISSVARCPVRFGVTLFATQGQARRCCRSLASSQRH